MADLPLWGKSYGCHQFCQLVATSCQWHGAFKWVRVPSNTKKKNTTRWAVFFFLVRERGLDDRFAPGGKSYGCHQFLNWWPPHATGMRHLNGFESTSNMKKKTTTRLGGGFLFGAREGTRTPTA